MKLVIIESPYAGNTERNTAYARFCTVWAEKQGAAPFASHLFCPQFFNDKDLIERRRGIQIGYQWMRVCDEVWFFEDFGWSSGMEMALQVAGALGKPCMKYTILSEQQKNILIENHPDSESTDRSLSVVKDGA